METSDNAPLGNITVSQNSSPLSNILEDGIATVSSSAERMTSPLLNYISEVKTVPVDHVPDCSNVSEVYSAQKLFSSQQKEAHKIKNASGEDTMQRRFSPRLKNMAETKRPCYGTCRKYAQRQQNEQNGDGRTTMDFNNNQITYLDHCSHVAGNKISKIDLPDLEQSCLHERISRKERHKFTMGGDSAMSDLVISAASSVDGSIGHYTHQNGKWLNSCTQTSSAAHKVIYERVKETVRTLNAYRRQFAQMEDASENHAKASKQPDLKALSKMFETKAVMYPVKRIGHLPGIDVGHQFYSRAEMVALGFHGDWLHGIDYMEHFCQETEEYKGLTFPLAVAIVLNDEYEENQSYSEYTICTDQGEEGIIDKMISHDHITLKNNLEQAIPVRVARRHKSERSCCVEVFTYDGLYEVVECSIQKCSSGALICKYRLRWLAGQRLPTKKVCLTRELSNLPGLVCMDISGGLEEICIPAFNLVDDTSFPPPGFTYSKCIQVAENVELPVNTNGCSCRGNCKNPKNCACARLNGHKFPYIRQGGGRLRRAKDVVFECGPNCGCGPDCLNRVSQRGIKYHLEVFRTPNRGWAVRTRDFIPSGAIVCEYVGVLKRTDEADKDDENDYIFEIDCLHTIMGVDGREKRLGNIPESIRSELEKIDDLVLQSTPEFCIDAGTIGNIARFINHSCEPNVFVQCVLSAHHDLRLARIVLFAAENIDPLQEITYDYCYALDSVVGLDGKIKQQPCFCGAAECRKRLY